MYGYVYSYSYGKIGGAIDLSLYTFTTWQPTTNIDGTREIVNEGSANNLTLYSGSGTSFNGTNQYVPIDEVSLSGDFSIGFSFVDCETPLDASIIGDNTNNNNYIRLRGNDSIRYKINNVYQDIIMDSGVNFQDGYNCIVVSRENNVVTTTVNGETQANTTVLSGTFNVNAIGKWLSGLYFNGTFKDFYGFNRALTQQEITKNYEQPEQFYIDALSDNTCVLNMPMCDTDTNVRNMANYSEGSELIINSGFDTSNVDNWLENPVIIENSELKVEIASTSSKLKYPLSGLEIGEYYIWTFDVRAESDSFPLRVGGFDYVNGGGESVFPRLNYFINTSTRTITRIGKATTSTVTLMPHRDNQLGTYYIDNFSFKKLSGIHPLLNHTTDTNVNNLQYGTQNLKLPMDSLGKRDGTLSDYIVGDGVGIAKIPSATRTTNIELVVNPTSLDGNVLSGGASLPASGLTLNQDNTINLANQTITSEVTLLNGFKGTLKSYKETEI